MQWPNLKNKLRKSAWFSFRCAAKQTDEFPFSAFLLRCTFVHQAKQLRCGLLRLMSNQLKINARFGKLVVSRDRVIKNLARHYNADFII